MPIRISVLASGEILVDGKHVELDQLDAILEAAKSENPTVWYYREAAAKDAPPEAMAVIQLAIQHKLPISISSKPDFSDYIDSKGVSHPRAAQPEPRMPEVVCRANIEEVFANIRKIAAGDKGKAEW